MCGPRISGGKSLATAGRDADTPCGVDRAAGSPEADGPAGHHVVEAGTERQSQGAQRGQRRRGEGDAVHHAARPAGDEERAEGHLGQRVGQAPRGDRGRLRPRDLRPYAGPHAARAMGSDGPCRRGRRQCAGRDQDARRACGQRRISTGLRRHPARLSRRRRRPRARCP